MSQDEIAGRPLSVPKVERRHFPRNFINQAVCELRFPTLFELESERPPAELAAALRKEFPTHERLTNLNIRTGGVGKSIAHAFRSRKDRWAVTIRAAAISLETFHYDSFEEFDALLTLVLRAAMKTIDSDFFTRIGLRYINGIPCDRGEVTEWISPALAAPLVTGVFGDPKEFSQRIAGSTDIGGGYLVQHGFGTNQKTGKPEYMIDLDFYVEDVDASAAGEAIRELHRQEHQLFRWCLGPRAEKHVGL